MRIYEIRSNESGDGLKMTSNKSSSLVMLKYRGGQVNGGWWLGSMATTGPGTPDTLDG